MGLGSCPGADCLQTCGECWVTCVTIISIIVGVIVMLIGIFMLLATTVLASTLNSILSSSLGALLSQYSTTSSSSISVTTLFAGLTPVAIAFLITGVAMIAFGAVGCSGACEKKTCCTAFYTAFWGVLILGELIVLIWYAANQSTWISTLNSTVISNINEYYTDLWQTDMNTYSLTWNQLMFSEKCCGYANYTDFRSASLFYKSTRLNVTCNGQFALQEVPVACCPCDGSFPSITPKDYCCLAKPNSTNSYISTPCFNAMQTAFYTSYAYIVGCTAGLIGLEILLFLMLVFLTVRYHKVDVKKA